MKKKKLLLSIACLSLFLSGCSAPPQTTTDGKEWQESWTAIGGNIGIDAPDQLTLLDVKEELAADGLYYATWVDGNSVPYENSDGDTVDLYDAQLYFLASETTSEKSAQENCSTWLAAAKATYDVLSETAITCNGQPYTLITYNCVGEDTPYDRGVSAFGTCGVNAVCIELTCLENYKEDLSSLLTRFLDGCHFSAD